MALSLYNGSTIDRVRSNHEATALASAARTTATNSADLVNYNTVVVGSSADPLRGFNGYMADVGWFNYALTPSQITAVYKGAPTACHLAPQGSAFSAATGLITVCAAGSYCLGGTLATIAAKMAGTSSLSPCSSQDGMSRRANRPMNE